MHTLPYTLGIQEISTKTTNLSSRRFYFEINLKFNITCIISRLYFCRKIYFIKCSIFCRICNKSPFFNIYRWKIYLLLGYILKSSSIFAKASSEQIKTTVGNFFGNLKSEFKNLNFLGSHEKNLEKKSASIFSKEGHDNTDQKHGLRQIEILEFKCLNSSKRHF